jgi:hypothetical protein
MQPTQTAYEFIAPNPVRRGGDATLRLAGRHQRVAWKIYNIAGELVDHVDFGRQTFLRWSSRGTAAGVYFVILEITANDGTLSYQTHKIALMP